MPAANPEVASIRGHIKRSYTELNELISGPIADLYANKLYEVPIENEWTIMENLAHIVEFMPYWAGQVAKLVARPGQQFGRTMQQEERLAALRDHGQDSLEQVKEALPGRYARLDDVLSHLQ